jgi:hypothetical protein
VGRANEAEVALVDEVGERDALVLIFLGNGDDESQVRANQRVERFLIVDADALRQQNLLLAIDQWIGTDVAEVLVERSFVERGFLGRDSDDRLRGTYFTRSPNRSQRIALIQANRRALSGA